MTRSGCSCRRKSDNKPGSYGLIWLYPNLASVRVHNMLHDGQPQSRPTEFARPGFIHAIETLEDPRSISFGNADAVIGHGELDQIARPPIVRGV